MCLKNLLIAFPTVAYSQAFTNNLSSRIKLFSSTNYLGIISVHSNIKPVGFQVLASQSSILVAFVKQMPFHIHQACYKIPALIYLLNKCLWSIY